jgi:putative transposase
MEPAAECMLVMIGATPEGKKELARGLQVGPDLAVADGALGFWKTVDEVFPGTRHQRCWLHKAANILNKVPKSVPQGP